MPTPLFNTFNINCLGTENQDLELNSLHYHLFQTLFYLLSLVFFHVMINNIRD